MLPSDSPEDIDRGTALAAVIAAVGNQDSDGAAEVFYAEPTRAAQLLADLLEAVAALHPLRPS